MPDEPTVMEQIVSLCKRRGFVYPASDIYGGINGFWDYGPLGVLLKNNIRDWWWRHMVECPPVGPDGRPLQIVGLDSAIIQHPKTWVASGHVGGFNDPMMDDRATKRRYRADHLFVFFPRGFKTEHEPFGIAVEAGSLAEADERLDEMFRSGALANRLWRASRKTGFNPLETFGLGAQSGDRLSKTDFSRVFGPEGEGPGEWEAVPATNLDEQKRLSTLAPDAEELGTLTEARQFNLMFESHAGVVKDDASKVYLRPETAQGIFLNFANIVDTTRVKMPFGVAQVGKAFRNEVTPRNFIFRSREFEQMEMEWFCHEDEAAKWYEFWKAERMKWWRSLGVGEANLRFRDHEPDELSHYSKMTVDIEYRYPFTSPDFGELEGIAHRGCFDLSQHQQQSGQKLEYFDQERNQRYIPNVIEPASGLTRAVLVLLCEAFTPDDARASKVFMKFDPKFAPIKAGIFPLVNKDGMPEVAEKLYLDLRTRLMCEYDPKQSIGRRYARMDEIGTPFCVTVDGQTLQDQTVTIRERDAMTQVRVSTDKVLPYLLERL